MRVWANLRHDNVVALLGHTMDAEGPALVAPFYENGCVVDYLTKHPMANRHRIVS